MTQDSSPTAAADQLFDLFVIGGGVNGCGIARDAVGRGYSVHLAEMNDLASGTSSKATKLIHGGLRYLEYYEFRLVREALTEREIVWGIAPHLVRPLRFVLPYFKGLRPAWMLRLGLFLYDYIGGRKKLPPTRTLNLRTDVTGKPLKPIFDKGFEYSDCWVNDARFVAMNARDAADRGATIRTRCKVVSARSEDGIWHITLRDQRTGQENVVRARMMVNAAGPWVDHVLADVVAHKEPNHVRLVQGSHIIVRKMYDHDRCYIFQNPDGRIIFAIPYEDDFTLIGTTDQDYKDDPAKIAITPEETAYLCKAASEYFAKEITPNDVVWTYSGVRPLYDDHASAAQAATRDYVIKEERINGAPLANIFGGKITTYRRLSESILEHVEKTLGAKGKSWTGTVPLPGGDLPGGDIEQFIKDLRARKPFVSAELARRFARAYGTRVWRFLDKAQNYQDLGQDFGGGLTSAEIDYLVREEWAVTAEDILWRRSKLGLHLPSTVAADIGNYLAAQEALQTR
ncbi:glycerol-3-phosphate dehydrogenase [Methylovirgula sp. 4M-Z18]|uniref:glycerol-3-phosphate dehydrogenase n=1 Tax=Methylovirgula sp. 4M-Z18 TaxID=2293567 RepID=UPI000E2F6714|nr:glycerol-3-phosphate dehydrogenase [Methylovirgula sp. 4M-Z18]RFB80500.1 glycerol-3-phosphate dehydrogenase [Methylovirgula sp. 4M-Z18]